MFRIIYAAAGGETVDPTAVLAAVHAAGFAGVELPIDAEMPQFRAVRGRRLSSVGHIASFARERLDYCVLPPAMPGTRAAAHGSLLREVAEANPGLELMQESGGAFASAAELWALLEAARHPRVKIALTFDASSVNARLEASVAIPTLNHRIGIVRLRAWDDGSTRVIQKLAGIGYEGFVVVDPSDLQGRLMAAAHLREQVQNCVPAASDQKTMARSR